MTRFRRLTALLAALVAAVLLNPAAPAGASLPQAYSMTVVNGETGRVETVLRAASLAQLQARSASQCGGAYANDVCVWQNYNFTGWFFHWSHGYIYGQAGHCMDLVYNVSNQVSAAGNHSPYIVYLKDGFDCAGASFTLYQGRNVSTSGYDNKASSILATALQ